MFIFGDSLLHPLVHAHSFHRVELLTQGDDGVQTHYMTLIEKDKEDKETLLQKAIFLQNKEEAQYFQIHGAHSLWFDQNSFFSEINSNQNPLKYQLGLEGLLTLILPQDFTGRFEVIGASHFKIRSGNDLLEVKNALQSNTTSFVFEKTSKDSWIIDSLPSRLDRLTLFSKGNWINKASFSVDDPLEIQSSLFQNEGVLNALKGGALKLGTFLNEKKGTLKSSSRLKIGISEESFNHGLMDVGGTLTFEGTSFTNTGELDFSMELYSTLHKFVNLKNIQGIDEVVLKGKSLVLEKESTFVTHGSVNLDFKKLVSCWVFERRQTFIIHRRPWKNI